MPVRISRAVTGRMPLTTLGCAASASAAFCAWTRLSSCPEVEVGHVRLTSRRMKRLRRLGQRRSLQRRLKLLAVDLLAPGQHLGPHLVAHDREICGQLVERRPGLVRLNRLGLRQLFHCGRGAALICPPLAA